MTSSAEPSLPSGYSITEMYWNALNEGQRAAVLHILEKGGAVSVASAQNELPDVTILLVLTSESSIVGIGTIKPKREWYANLVQAMDRSAYHFDPKILELGYVVVAEDHQGKKLSGAITTALLNRYNGPLFATTDDKKMKLSLGHRGFEQRGNEWKGKRGVLSLWLKGVE